MTSNNPAVQTLIAGAKQLVRERRYDEAVSVLRSSAHIDAQRALARLEANLAERGLRPTPAASTTPEAAPFTFAFDVAAQPVGVLQPVPPAHNDVAPAPLAAPPTLTAHDVEMALLRTKSFAPHAVAALALLSLAVWPGLIAAVLFSDDAIEITSRTGKRPRGAGCLTAVIVLGIVLIVPGTILAVNIIRSLFFLF